jgi:hypothetical protein
MWGVVPQELVLAVREVAARAVGAIRAAGREPVLAKPRAVVERGAAAAARRRRRLGRRRAVVIGRRRRGRRPLCSGGERHRRRGNRRSHGHWRSNNRRSRRRRLEPARVRALDGFRGTDRRGWWRGHPARSIVHSGVPLSPRPIHLRLIQLREANVLCLVLICLLSAGRALRNAYTLSRTAQRSNVMLAPTSEPRRGARGSKSGLCRCPQNPIFFRVDGLHANVLHNKTGLTRGGSRPARRTGAAP